MHVGVVGLLTPAALVLYALGDPEDGANIGAGIAMLPLLALGLPWTIPVFADPYQFDDWSTGPWLTITLGPAVLNLAVHAVVRVRKHRSAKARQV